MSNIAIGKAPKEYREYLTNADAQGNANKTIDTMDEAQIAVDEYCKAPRKAIACFAFKTYINSFGFNTDNVETLKSGVLSKDATIGGQTVKKGTKITFFEVPTPKVLSKDQTLNGVKYKKGAKLEPPSEKTFFENGKPKLVVLLEDHTVNGMVLKKGSKLKLYPGGGIELVVEKGDKLRHR